MIVCPLCEHSQVSGDVCEQCGKALSSRRTVAVTSVAMEGLEATQWTGSGDPLDAAPLPELEATRLRSGPDLPEQRVPDLEQAVAAAVPDLPVTPLQELERGRAEPEGAATPAPGLKVVCRYCRNEQSEGALCDRCGMRLPRVISAAPELVPGENWIPCPKCGERAMPGRRCGGCGAHVELAATGT